MICPNCGKKIEKNVIAAALGSIGGSVTSDAKAEASRNNGKKGGYPKGRPRKPKP